MSSSGQMPPAEIAVTGLGKVYPPALTPRSLLRGGRASRRALEGVSFHVRPGEVLGLIGPNGAGKSTLLRILSGVLLPTEGAATVGGVDVTERGGRARAHVGAALSDDRGLSARLSARHNLEFFGTLYGLSAAQLRERTEALAARFEAAHLLDREVRTLSTGEKARIVLLRALLHSPRAVLLDELTRSLDPGAAERVRRHIREDVGTRDAAVVLASHDLAEVESLCSRVLLLANGKIAALGTFAEVKPEADRVFAAGGHA